MVEYQDLAHFHYTNFSQFLGKKSSSTTNFQAKNKLAKLSPAQFSELATDVNDEINRRKSDEDDHLPPVSEYSAKRNLAREKLSTLSTKRFMDLAADVLGELLRRFPECQNENLAPSSSSVASAQNVAPTNVAPPKVAPSNASSPSSSLGSKFHSVAISSFDNRQNTERNKMMEYEKKMNDYQSQITDYELKNLELEAKVFKYSQMKKEYSEMESELQRLKISEESTKEAHKQIESKYLSLEEQYQGLKEDYGNQEQMTVAIRAEANTLLEEVKNINYEKEKLAAMNKELLVKYKKYKEKNQKLEDENKRMAERLKAFESLNDLVQGSGDPIESAHEEQTDALESADESNLSLPNFQNETMSLTDTGASNFLSKEMPPKVHVPPETTAVEQNVKETESLAAGQPRMPNFADDSLVSRQCVFAYEEALQELYLNSEMGESTGILISMKEIVLSCKAITEEVSKLSTKIERDELIDAKADLSAALTKLMGASKTHAGNPSAESLQSLYSFGSGLTAVLEKLVNSLSASSQVNHDQGEKQDNSSVDDATNAYYAPGAQNGDNEQLKQFLEQQTDEIVRSIQSLLNLMRQPGPYGDEFMGVINQIMIAVDLVVANCRTSMMDRIGNPRIGESFEELNDASRRLESLGTQIVGSTGELDKQLKQQIASYSYEIAKFVKELLTYLE